MAENKIARRSRFQRSERHGTVADKLLAAYENRAPIARLVEQHLKLTIHDSYLTQQLQVRHGQTQGATIRGH
ncbi:hypothetical protein [Rhodococcus sp. DK17]|uniref:hypothetical protein n=1 Tax=Rhodococcus sp. DK17 TaxID=186196 RepID=UPI0013042A0A|nr:hypothetical protein [Rhodococcus sp. DK17]